MFASAVFELAGAGRPLRFTSHHALAWVLDQIRQRAPDVAAALHGSTRTKPFTVWAGTYDELGGVFTPAAPEACALLRVTSLSEPVSRLLRQIVDDRPSCATLGSARLEIVSCATSAAAHPLAGASTPAALASSIDATVRFGSRVTVHFLTPTAFGGEVVNTLFPLPALVFRSILGKWNAHAGLPIDSALAEDLLQRVQVEAHHLATRPPVRLRDTVEKGFIGWCEYSAGRDAAAAVVRAMHLLARAAFYTGVGARTTMGMGQVVCEGNAEGLRG